LSLWCSCGWSRFLGNGTCCVIWSSYYGSFLVRCSKGGTSTITISLCASSWGCCGFGMVQNIRTSGMGNVLHIYFLLLIIRDLSSFSSSSESFVVLCSLAHIYLGNMLDDTKGCLVCCNFSLNSKVFTHDVEASCTLVGIASGGIYRSMSRNKCCIKISMTNVEWQISFLGSTFIIPIIILVWEAIHLINSFYSCLNKVFAQSTSFPFTTIIIDMTFLLLKYQTLSLW
jgi:hypothetical protein